VVDGSFRSCNACAATIGPEVQITMKYHEAPASEMDAIVTGGTTNSHPSASDDVEINRSGSGGTGGPAVDDDEMGERQAPP
jgi:hypothetical protein